MTHERSRDASPSSTDFLMIVDIAIVSLDFIVKTSEEMTDYDKDGGLSSDTHNRSIRFGLVSKRLSPHASEFLCTRATYERLAGAWNPDGPSLRVRYSGALLPFISSVAE